MGNDWRDSPVIYQVYPRSFFDTTGNGVGDLPGIIQKLDYIKDTGADAIWISPFFQSPQRDFGYDISDYLSIFPEYGTIGDCDRLIEQTHQRNMKILFDLVLNHTSDEHPWFIESSSSIYSPKRDWYLWQTGRRPGKPPTNWQSMVFGNGWQHHPATDSWYWCSFLDFQPDLNWHNSEVQQQMFSIMHFWLERGVDGFRLDLFDPLYKDQLFRDNPFAWKVIPDPEKGFGTFQRSIRTRHLSETLAMTKQLRKITESYTPPRILLAEVFAPAEKLREYCGGKQPDGLNLVFFFQGLSVRFSARAYRKLIEEAEYWFAQPFSPAWVFSNHDRMRFISRLGDSQEKAKLHMTFAATVRGALCVYYGEEIGMPQHALAVRDSQDAVARRLTDRLPYLLVCLADRLTGGAVNRDNCRTPMQWDDSAHAGFCPPEADPWLPAAPRGSVVNVSSQMKDPSSVYNTVKALLTLRKERKELQSGELTLAECPNNMLGYYRSLGDRHLLILLNFSSRTGNISPLSQGGRAFNRVLFSTKNTPRVLRENGLTLAPWEGVLLEQEDISPKATGTTSQD